VEAAHRQVEADHQRVINSQTSSLDQLQEVVGALDRTTNAVGEGLNMAVSRIDADLTALNERVDHRRRECETNEVVLDLYKARLAELEKLFNAQTVKLAELESRMDTGMCRCGKDVKGKEKEVVPVEEDIPDVLGSPITLPPTAGSSSSYLTPPIAHKLSSAEVEESLVSPLVLMDEENNESEPRPGVGMVDTYRRFEALPGGFVDVAPFICETRSFLQHHSEDILAVRGQRAFRSQGPPSHRFNPYTSIRRHLRPGRQFLFRPSRAHCHVGSADDELSPV